MEEMIEAIVVLHLLVPVRATPDRIKAAILEGARPGNMELVDVAVSIPGEHMEEMV